MSITKNDNAVVMNRESLQYLANCIRLVHSLPELLNDVLPSQTTTYSSYKVTELLNTLNTDLQNYVNSALGNLSHLKKEIASTVPTSDVAEEDTIYLVQDASGGYEQYLKINGVVTSLGSTSAINNVYTKTESDGKFGLLSTLNSLITVVGGLNDLTTTDKTSIVNAINELKTDLTTHTSDTDIHVTTAERTKWNKVDNKIDKTDITTIIDDSSTDNQVPSAKSIYYNCIEGIQINQKTIDTYGTEILKYPLGIWRITGNNLASKFTDLPDKTSGRIEITSIDANVNNTPFNNPWSYRVYNFETYKGENYIRKIASGNTIGVITNDSGWKKVCTTKVADVGKTSITSNNTDLYTIGQAYYRVKNGICYINFWPITVKKTGTSMKTGKIFPKSLFVKSIGALIDANGKVGGVAYIDENGELRLGCNLTNIALYCSFSYPVENS